MYICKNKMNLFIYKYNYMKVNNSEKRFIQRTKFVMSNFLKHIYMCQGIRKQAIQFCYN